jgi:chorismate mutase/prephenate dehydratase
MKKAIEAIQEEKEKLGHMVAYLGPPGTHTHLACFKHFGNSIYALSKEGIQEVFEAVEKGEAGYGVVPIENSTEGSVNRTLDLFIESEVKICGEVMVQVSHDLLSQSGRAEDIRKIYSHPQALEQCRKWLRKNFPHIQVTGAVSTAKAAQIAAEDANAAGIANSFAAQFYGLKVIQSQIEDYVHNYTRFFVLSQEIGNRTGEDKTSLLFSISHTPGSLYRVLKIFSERGINLTKIESRPMKGKPWEYIFFIDFEGHATDSNVAEVLDEVKEYVLFVKLLGSYPQKSQEK